MNWKKQNNNNNEYEDTHSAVTHSQTNTKPSNWIAMSLRGGPLSKNTRIIGDVWVDRSRSDTLFAENGFLFVRIYILCESDYSS